MFAQWIDRHRSEIVEACVVMQQERGGLHVGQEELRRGVEAILAVLVSFLRGEVDWAQGIETSARNVLATGVPMETLAAASRGIYLAVRQILNAKYHTRRRQWLDTLADHMLASSQVMAAMLECSLEERIADRTRSIEASRVEERERLQREVIEAQRQALQELSTPIIPVMEHIIVMPLIGSVDSMRARDITRSLLAGIRKHRAEVVILDVTGVPVVDSGVANHLNKTIQAARLKGARTIVTGISDAVAETIVDLGIDWSGIETLSDLQTGLIAALGSLGMGLVRREGDKVMRRRGEKRGDLTSHPGGLDNG